MAEALFADLASGTAGKVAEYAIKSLAVAGGFLVGYFAGKGLAWVLDKWVFANKAPAQLKQLCAVLCGLALAVVVALIVFGSGGGGLFGGGGGTGKGTDPSNEKGKESSPPQENPKAEPPKAEPKPTEPKSAVSKVVQVTILSGTKPVEGKFYRIGTDATELTLEDLKGKIPKSSADAPPMVIVYRFDGEPLKNSHPAVEQLTRWALDEAKIQIGRE